MFFFEIRIWVFVLTIVSTLKNLYTFGWRIAEIIKTPASNKIKMVVIEQNPMSAASFTTPIKPTSITIPYMQDNTAANSS